MNEKSITIICCLLALESDVQWPSMVQRRPNLQMWKVGQCWGGQQVDQTFSESLGSSVISIWHGDEGCHWRFPPMTHRPDALKALWYDAPNAAPAPDNARWVELWCDSVQGGLEDWFHLCLGSLWKGILWSLQGQKHQCCLLEGVGNMNRPCYCWSDWSPA